MLSVRKQAFFNWQIQISFCGKTTTWLGNPAESLRSILQGFFSSGGVRGGGKGSFLREGATEKEGSCLFFKAAWQKHPFQGKQTKQKQVSIKTVSVREEGTDLSVMESLFYNSSLILNIYNE